MKHLEKKKKQLQPQLLRLHPTPIASLYMQRLIRRNAK